MPTIPSTSLAAILPKTIHSCLTQAPGLKYNWDSKLRQLILGIAISQSLVLQKIAQLWPGSVPTRENILSRFLSQSHLKLDGAQQAFVTSVIKRLGKRRLWRHQGKAVVIIDSTSYAKLRSRGKIRPMPQKGKVLMHNLPTKEKVLAPGYQEIWLGVLLKDKTFLPLTRRLWTERGPDAASLNLVEEAEILRACDLIQKALKLDLILVADRGFRRKDLLAWLKKDLKVDFLIRLEGKLTVSAVGWKGLLTDVALGWKDRVRMHWRDDSKKPLISDVSASRVSVALSAISRFAFNVLCLKPVQDDRNPMFLATTLPISELADIMALVRLYSARWTIETFFWMFKNDLGAQSWRVFSC